MMYSVKSIEYTIQGEGYHVGTPAIFVRFAGCNLWSGLEKDRETAECRFCDTDFVGEDGLGGGAYSVKDLVEAIADAGPSKMSDVVFTGGEPALQMNYDLVSELDVFGFRVAVETNGTRKLPWNVDWVTVSPKAGSGLMILRGDELKLAYPQPGLIPEMLENYDFKHFFLQPMDGPDYEANLAAAIEYCLEHPHWRLSLQTHKRMGVP